MKKALHLSAFILAVSSFVFSNDYEYAEHQRIESLGDHLDLPPNNQYVPRDMQFELGPQVGSSSMIWQGNSQFPQYNRQNPQYYSQNPMIQYNQPLNQGYGYGYNSSQQYNPKILQRDERQTGDQHLDAQ